MEILPHLWGQNGHGGLIMFITKKKFQEALEEERAKATKEAEERCWRFDVERRNNDRVCKLEADVAKLQAIVYQPKKRWPHTGKPNNMI